MNAKGLLSALSREELLEVHTAMPAELERRGIELPYAAGNVAVEGARKDAEATAVPDTRESLIEQLPSAYEGYRAVHDSFNEGRQQRVLTAASEKQVAKELEAWLTADKVAYIAATQEADPSLRYTLVATRNRLFKPKYITKAAKAFGKNQPCPTHVYDALYEQYTVHEVSGTDPHNDNSVQFSLIPNSRNPELKGTVEQQRTTLAKLQNDLPFLKVPSVLEAITCWQTLRAQGDQLREPYTIIDRTYIRHFDLSEKRIDDWSYVPVSYVGGNGGPTLDYSLASNVSVGRVSVG